MSNHTALIAVCGAVILALACVHNTPAHEPYADAACGTAPAIRTWHMNEILIIQSGSGMVSLDGKETSVTAGCRSLSRDDVNSVAMARAATHSRRQ